jgi:putative membrane protein
MNILLTSARLQQWPHHQLHPDGAVWWMHWFWMIVWIALIVLVVVVVVRALSTGSRRQDEPARAILERRYAAGEISTEEYEERKKRL